MPQIIPMDSDTWRIEDTGVRFFLLEGSREALLIDSGMTTRNAREIAESLTRLPLKLLNTHADMDHVAGNGAFECFYLHPAECANYYKGRARGRGQFVPVLDGDILDLGDRPLEILHIPGHTEGSIAVLDIKNRVLVSGDPIQDGSIYMFGPHRELNAYIYSIDKVMARKGDFDQIWPSHGSVPVYPDILPKLKAGVEKILSGELRGEPAEAHGTPITRYDIGVAAILGDRAE